MKQPRTEMTNDENPEWSETDFPKARSAKEVLPRLFGKKTAMMMLKPKRGRPIADTTKKQIAIRFDPDILSAFRNAGPGWQTRINKALADWLKTHSPEELPI